jgi:hypothetical protein
VSSISLARHPSLTSRTHHRRPKYAELLGDMYTQTLHAVNEHGAHWYGSVSSASTYSSHLIPCSVPADLPPETRARLIDSLERWHFEPHKLNPDEVLSCAQILFEALFRTEGMEEATGVSISAPSLLISLLPITHF